jgi:hypothetical protein
MVSLRRSCSTQPRTRFAIRCCFVDTPLATECLLCFRTAAPSPGIPLPYSLASPGRVFQLSNGTMRMLRLPTVHLAVLCSPLVLQYHACFPLLCPHLGSLSPESTATVPGYIPPSSSTGYIAWKPSALPSSQGLPCAFALLSDPAQPVRLAIAAFRCYPRCSDYEGHGTQSFFRGSITRLLHSLSTLRAVITADYARLASGWWLAFAGWDWSPTEVQ